MDYPGVSRERESIRCIFRWKKFYYEEWLTKEAETPNNITFHLNTGEQRKPHALTQSTFRIARAGAYGVRIEKREWVGCYRVRTGRNRMGWMKQRRKNGREKPVQVSRQELEGASISCALLSPSTGWLVPTHLKKGKLAYSVWQSQG